jgi:hypothetical protein
MPGFTGDLDVDLERGLAECASKTIMTHIFEKGFHGQWKMIKVHIQAVAETAQVASKEEMCWLAIAAATAWLPAPEHTMTASLAADMADSRRAAPTSWNGRPRPWYRREQGLRRAARKPQVTRRRDGPQRAHTPG